MEAIILRVQFAYQPAGSPKRRLAGALYPCYRAPNASARRKTMATQKARHVLLVGSVPLQNAEEVFRTAGAILGERLRWIPDGETGERLGWIGWQLSVLTSHPQFETLPPDPNAYAAVPKVKLRSPGAARELTFGRLGYADAAHASYADFSRLKRAGILPAQCRFQVSLPTPWAPINVFVVPEAQTIVEPLYEARLLTELDEIATAIPHNELAIQWDVAVELANWEGVFPVPFSDVKRGIIERLVRIGNRVPPGVDLGYHLCYGDYQHQHFMQPKDAANMVEIANALSAAVARPIHWIHMPVPRDRTDDAYCAPLRDLRLRPETEFYLGLVHATDGLEGARQRVAAARKVIPDFGVATECGLGRRPPESIPDLLRLHGEVAALV